MVFGGKFDGIRTPSAYCTSIFPCYGLTNKPAEMAKREANGVRRATMQFTLSLAAVID